MMNRRKYKTNFNSFCYVCGKYTLPAHRRNIAHKMKTAYKCYFSCKVGDQDKKWHLKFAAFLQLSATPWAVSKQKKMPLAVPMIWREPTDHATDCYFCLTNTKGFF